MINNRIINSIEIGYMKQIFTSHKFHSEMIKSPFHNRLIVPVPEK